MPSIKDKMKSLGFSPKKFMGQNFLTNPITIQKIVSAVEELKPSFIMEVGPGLGALTNHFISFKCPFYVVEKDSLLCQYWQKRKVNVLKGDVLKLSWPSHLLPDAVLTGNLPYQIASRLMIQCCPGSEKIKAMVLMFQKEVAQRVLAAPRSKNYGLLSVLSQCFWKGHILTDASVSDFYPRPKVAGRVLIFHRKKQSVNDPAAFLSFVKSCFSNRRKFLLSRWKTTKEKDRIISILNKMKLLPSVRAEELSPIQFMFLFNELKNRKVRIIKNQMRP